MPTTANLNGRDQPTAANLSEKIAASDCLEKRHKIREENAWVVKANNGETAGEICASLGIGGKEDICGLVIPITPSSYFGYHSPDLWQILQAWLGDG